MKFISIIIGLVLFCVPAQAVTLDFTNVPGLGGVTPFYVEKGVVAQGIDGDLARHTTPGKVHLTDGGTSFASSVSFSASGRFNALQFDIDGESNYCLDFSCSSPEPFNNVMVVGERGGLVVASSEFFSGTSERTEILGSDFSDLDRLVISVMLPSDLASSTCIFFSPCSFFDIDNLSIEMVVATPLPAGLPLYGAGVVILGYLVRRRHKLQRS